MVESLRVFIIPSWYPSRYAPVAGIFIKDQVLYTSELRPKLKLAISLWEARRIQSDFAELSKSVPNSHRLCLV
jgi:hypothetical protein